MVAIRAVAVVLVGHSGAFPLGGVRSGPTRNQDVEINGIRYPVNEGEKFPMFFSVAQSPDRLVRLIDSPAIPVDSSFFERSSNGAVIHGFDCV